MAKQGNMIKSTHFKSCISVSLKDDNIDESYQKILYTELQLRAFVLSIVLLIAQTISLILMHYFLSSLPLTISNYDEVKSRLQLELIISFIIFGIAFLSFVCSLIAYLKKYFIKFSHLLNYLTLCLISNCILCYISIFSDSWRKEIMFKLDILFKVGFIFYIDYNFILITIASTISCVELIIDGLVISMLTYDQLYANPIILAVVVLFAHGYEKTFKIIYYYKYKILQKNEKLKTTLDRIQNGLIIIRNDQSVLYYNKYISNKLNFLLDKSVVPLSKSKNNIDDHIISINTVEGNPTNAKNKKNTESLNSSIAGSTVRYTVGARPKKNLKQKINEPDNMENLHQQDSVQNFSLCSSANGTVEAEVKINPKIFKDLENINPEVDSDVIECIRNDCPIEAILESIENTHKKGKQFQDFVFLGVKRFVLNDTQEEEENVTILEIYIRLVQNCKKVVFEFLLNDVTRSKITEEANAQIKYKSIFLAKVSHEFKNPLIMIKELSEQVDEGMAGLISGSTSPQILSEKVRLLRNLSNYMMILVKDFEVISKKECHSRIEIVKNYFDIREELEVLEQIVHALILKKHKKIDDAPVKFILDIGKEVPKFFFSDKTRLNQVLINLLSNSIKFTQSGTIQLNVSFDDSNGTVLFQVIDTGKGINPNEEKALFKDFRKGKEMNNAYGSGLGLSIVKELVTHLGGEIMYTRSEPNGSNFYFSLPAKDLPLENLNRETNMENDYIQTEIKDFFYNLQDQVESNNEKVKRCQTYLNSKYLRECAEDSEFILTTKNIKSTNPRKKDKDAIIPKTRTFLKNNFGDPDKFGSYFNEVKIIRENTSISHQKENNISDTPSVVTTPSCYNKKTKIFNNPIIFTKGTSIDMINTPFQKNNSSFDNLSVTRSFEYLYHNENTFVCAKLSKISKCYEFSAETAKLNPRCPLSRRKSSKECPHVNDPHQMKKLTLIVSDDDFLVRKSIIRVIEKYLAELNVRLDVMIIEASDGLECLFAVYNSLLQNIHIDLIISDETMNYMSGSFSLEILSRLITSNIIPYKIPVTIVSAYEDNIDNKSKYQFPNLSGIFSKPVSKTSLENIFKMVEISPKVSLLDTLLN